VSFVISYKSVDNHVDILSLAESNEDCEIHPEITLLKKIDALRTENVLIYLFLRIYLWYWYADIISVAYRLGATLKIPKG